jgi:hypothetical protein
MSQGAETSAPNETEMGDLCKIWLNDVELQKAAQKASIDHRVYQRFIEKHPDEPLHFMSSRGTFANGTESSSMGDFGNAVGAQNLYVRLALSDAVGDTKVVKWKRDVYISKTEIERLADVADGVPRSPKTYGQGRQRSQSAEGQTKVCAIMESFFKVIDKRLSAMAALAHTDVDFFLGG